MEDPRTACGSKEIDKKLAVDYKGVKIFFCEQSCVDEFNADPEKFIASDHMRIKLPIKLDTTKEE